MSKLMFSHVVNSMLKHGTVMEIWDGASAGNLTLISAEGLNGYVFDAADTPGQCVPIEFPEQEIQVDDLGTFTALDDLGDSYNLFIYRPVPVVAQTLLEQAEQQA